MPVTVQVTPHSPLFQSIENTELAEAVLKRQNRTIYPELFVQFQPSKCFLPKEYARHYDYIKNFPVRDDDVWVVSFIKSGEKLFHNLAILYSDFCIQFQWHFNQNLSLSRYDLDTRDDMDGWTWPWLRKCQIIGDRPVSLPWVSFTKKIKVGIFQFHNVKYEYDFQFLYPPRPP